MASFLEPFLAALIFWFLLWLCFHQIAYMIEKHKDRKFKEKVERYPRDIR